MKGGKEVSNLLEVHLANLMDFGSKERNGREEIHVGKDASKN